jgi:CubicO group peptidase (beta-lactamase class C family)
MNIKVKIVLSLLIFSFLFCSCSDETHLNDLDTFLKFKIERDNIPGLALLIMKNDEIVYKKVYGWANIDNKVPMTVNSTFCVASIAKSFTALAIMQLYENGKINIREPVNNYIPFKVDNPFYPEKQITIEQLLSHTSSISNGPSMWRNFSEGDPTITIEEWARGYFITDGKYYNKEGNFERWKPGEGFLYSNGGYGLLAYLVECVSGMSFNDYCKKNIFTPLEMKNTSFLISQIDHKSMATMYGYGDFTDLEKDLACKDVNADSAISKNKPFPLMNYSSPELGAGELYSSAEELSHFLVMLMNSGDYRKHHILKEDILKQMLSPNVSRELLPPWFVDLGMGFYSMKLDNGEPVWGHTGANPGISSYLFFNTEIKIGAIVLANRFVDIRDLITWVFSEAFNDFNDISLDLLNKNWREYSHDYLNNNYSKRKVLIRIKPESVPKNSSLYLNGNHKNLGLWISKGIPLDPKENGIWEKAFTFYDSTKINFKVTRGSWNMQAVDKNGADLPPFSLIVSNDTTLTIVINNWKDLFTK